MKKLLVLVAASAAVAFAEAAVTITGVNARQRWPWNGLVDVDFTIAGANSGDVFAIDLSAEYAGGDKKIAAYTYTTEPIAGNGSHRVTWNMGKDYPEFRAEDLCVSVTATPFSGDTPVYMVIDLSGGKDAAKYPVRYTTKAPAHVQGAANEPCQTTELWMRRIVAPSFAFSVNRYVVEVGDSKDSFWGKMTKDFYVGVFELTQEQYRLVMGDWPNSYCTNGLYRASRPAELTYRTLTGTQEDIQSVPSSITSASFLGKLREKTALSITLPSNIQLNFAARGGTELGSAVDFWQYKLDGVFLSGAQIARFNAGTTDRNCDTTVGTAYVGSYLPNDYGLYDVVGNVAEYTAERYCNTGYQGYYKKLFSSDSIGSSKENPVVDPPGVSVEDALYDMGGSTAYYRRLTRGGYWAASSVNLWTTDGRKQNATDGSETAKGIGFRLSMTVE